MTKLTLRMEIEHDGQTVAAWERTEKEAICANSIGANLAMMLLAMQWDIVGGFDPEQIANKMLDTMKSTYVP